GIARNQAEDEMPRYIKPQLGRAAESVVVVIVAWLAGCQQVEWGHGDRAGVQMINVGVVVERSARATDRGALIEGVERAALCNRGELRRAGAAFGNDIDHTANGIGAVKATLRAPQHLDGLDVLCQQSAELGSLTSMPSTSTLVWLAFVPRMKMAVRPPGPPACTTLRPGTSLRRSGSV